MAKYRRAPIRVLETDRLRLRPVQLSDAPRIQVIFPHPEVVRYLATAIAWPYPEDGAETFLRALLPKIEASEEYAWAIEIRGEEREGMIGLIALTPGSDLDHRGFWLAEPYWGKGYMREAASAVNDFAFDSLGMKELLLGNAAPNAASHRLKESAGAVIVGIEDEEFIGGVFPSVRWRLTGDAWRHHRAVKR
ncbi:N-acetyltransferase [bacterium]|nr:MAG: N-acetyltransferase [bacterium]